MKQLILAVFAIALTLPLLGYADSNHSGPSMNHGSVPGGMQVGGAIDGMDSSTMSGMSSDSMSSGTVRKINRSSGTITLRHGPLQNLGMPGMTMVFRVQDPAMLEQVKTGDKVNFIAERVNGALTVTTLQPAK